MYYTVLNELMFAQIKWLLEKPCYNNVFFVAKSCIIQFKSTNDCSSERVVRKNIIWTPHIHEWKRKITNIVDYNFVLQ